MANELKGTLQQSKGLGVQAPASELQNFQSVLRDISRQTYDKQAKTDSKSNAMTGAGIGASDISGGAFSSIMGALEQMRGGDISKEYAAGVAGYKDTLDAIEKKRTTAAANSKSAFANMTNAQKQIEWLQNQGKDVPASLWIMAGTTPGNPTTSGTIPTDMTDAASYLANAHKGTDTFVSPDDYTKARDEYIKTQNSAVDDPVKKAQDAKNFDNQFGKYLSDTEKGNLGITVTKTDIPPEYTDFLQGKTSEQQNAFLSLPERQKSSVQQLVNGDALLSDIISSRGVQGSADRQRLIMDAQKIDPTFSVNTNKIRYEFLKKWNDPANKVGLTRNAINTALGHLAEVKGMTNALSPSDWQTINKTKNWWSTESGSPAINNLNFGLTALATEIASVYKGGTPTEEEIKQQRSVLGTQLSSGQFEGILNKQSQFLSSKIASTRYQYSSTMGKEYDQSIIDPEKKQALIDAGIDPNMIAKENIKGEATHVKAGNVEYPVGSTIEVDGVQYTVNSDGTATPINQ
ncbi:MAG: hypothetical protein NTW30_06125 [Candidatus Aenigmarchaeota archaeon]|nr:hypothetical protein [Candidatus Aenigmarchaeota archaeon]